MQREELNLAIRSFADMTSKRVLDVGRAFDAHPELRPRRVGGDPARIKIDPSMEAVIRRTELPIDWLTVRRNERSGAFELGEIKLYGGRGLFMSRQGPGEGPYTLTGHKIEQAWLEDSVASRESIEDVASLFEALVVASDAAWGCVLPWAWHPRPLYTLAIAKLPGVYWLNYFGPAFLDCFPELATVTGARLLDAGGVLVRTTDDPWQPYEASVPEWQVELREALGKDAFEWAQPNRALPSPDQHVAASPGTQEMPWIRWEAKLAIENANLADEKQGKKHTASRRRLEKALAGRTEPVLAPDATEWSTSLDLEDWDGFAKHITRKLRGDFASASGRAAVAVIATAPLESEESVLLITQYGTVRLGWFINDVDTIDVYLWGAPEVSAACYEWFD